MSTSHGPFLTYIVRNEQRQKLATAEQARLAQRAQPDPGHRPGWIHHLWAQRGATWLLQRLPALRRRMGLGSDAWPLAPREHADRPNPRLSS